MQFPDKPCLEQFLHFIYCHLIALESVASSLLLHRPVVWIRIQLVDHY
jgi:hypothetical protein